MAIAKPDNNGTVTLSSIPNGAASAIVAIKAPIMPILSSKPGTASATPMVLTRQAKEPSIDLFPNLWYPYLRPIRAAKVSPTIIKAIAVMAIVLGKRAIVRQKAERI